jgi:hypothetical protein
MKIQDFVDFCLLVFGAVQFVSYVPIICSKLYGPILQITVIFIAVTVTASVLMKKIWFNAS